MRYDLVTINGFDLPDVKKGSVTITPNPKFTSYDCEDGGKIIDVLEEHMITGSVKFNGLLQSDIESICEHISIVSEMSIYSPINGQVKTFMALVQMEDLDRIIHDANANAWGFGFKFEEIGNVPD